MTWDDWVVISVVFGVLLACLAFDLWVRSRD